MTAKNAETELDGPDFDGNGAEDLFNNQYAQLGYPNATSIVCVLTAMLMTDIV